MGVDDKDQFQKLLSMPGVVGVMIVNQDGLAVRSSLSLEETLKYGGQIAPLVEKARKVMQELMMGDEGVNEASRTQHEHDDLSFIKIRTMNYEILVSPCENGEYSMIGIQKSFAPESEEDVEEKGKVLPDSQD